MELREMPTTTVDGTDERSTETPWNLLTLLGFNASEFLEVVTRTAAIAKDWKSIVSMERLRWSSEV